MILGIENPVLRWIAILIIGRGKFGLLMSFDPVPKHGFAPPRFKSFDSGHPNFDGAVRE